MSSSEAKRQAAPSRAERLRRRGHRTGLVVFALVVAGATAVWSVQIVQQVLAPEPAGTEIECRPGVRALIAAVRRARQAAALETGGERASMARFRAALDPAWQTRPALDDACRDDREARDALRQVDLLRYAEEHAVRYGAVELAKRRRRIRALEARLRPHDAPQAPATGLEDAPAVAKEAAKH